MKVEDGTPTAPAAPRPRPAEDHELAWRAQFERSLLEARCHAGSHGDGKTTRAVASRQAATPAGSATLILASDGNSTAHAFSAAVGARSSAPEAPARALSSAQDQPTPAAAAYHAIAPAAMAASPTPLVTTVAWVPCSPAPSPPSPALAPEWADGGASAAQSPPFPVSDKAADAPPGLPLPTPVRGNASVPASAKAPVDRAAAAPPPSARPAYGRRLLQVGGDEELQANVRDASLTTDQQDRVAAALLSQVDTPRGRLTRVHVNGTTYLRSSRPHPIRSDKEE